MQNGVVTISLPAVDLDDRATARAVSTSRVSSRSFTHGRSGRIDFPRARNAAANASRPRLAHAPMDGEREFIAGPENGLLAATVDSIFEESPSPYNPLVLCGIPGVGKSHVASGIAARWRTAHPDQTVVVVTAADFARELAGAIQHETVSALRARYTAAGLVVIEELANLVTKRTAQDELTFLLDHWLSCDTQVVITSKVSPDEIAAFPSRLVSRLITGLILPLAAPGQAARTELIERQAAGRQIQIEPEAAKLLGEYVVGTVPELVAALLDLHLTLRTSANAATDTIITADHVRQFLGKQSATTPNLRGIASVTAKYFGLKVSDLTSPSRRRAVVAARGVAMYLARELTGKSLEQVGAHFGGRDHTTVLHSYRSTEKRLKTDVETRRAITELRTALTAA